MSAGGSDCGQFCYISDVRQDKVVYVTRGNQLSSDDIVLQVNKHQVSGMTQEDVVDLFRTEASTVGQRLTIHTLKQGRYKLKLLTLLTNTNLGIKNYIH